MKIKENDLDEKILTFAQKDVKETIVQSFKQNQLDLTLKIDSYLRTFLGTNVPAQSHIRILIIGPKGRNYGSIFIEPDGQTSMFVWNLASQIAYDFIIPKSIDKKEFFNPNSEIMKIFVTQNTLHKQLLNFGKELSNYAAAFQVH